VTRLPHAALPFSAGSRRIIFYLLYDTRGVAEDYVLYKLEKLREQSEFIFVVVNGDLTDVSRTALNKVADVVWTRPNIGFDVWGYKSALEQFGIDRLAEFDELILMNYTWFGPVRPFAPVFEKMNGLEADFWGMTEHAAVTPNPYTLKGTMPAHIQSHWIAVRSGLFMSEDWARYWQKMPMIGSYVDSILNHESKFTAHFTGLGYSKRVAFPLENYPADHPAFDNAQLLLDDGCPVLKRRPFFHSPLYLDREAIIGRWLIDGARSFGYPVEMIFENMARNAQPKVFNTNASMFEIMPDVEIGYDRSAPDFRIAAILHIFYEEMTDELIDRLAMLPSPFDLYITTTSEDKAESIRLAVVARNEPLVARFEVRVLGSNRGRDLSGFFVACRDVTRSSDYDLVVKIHSKKTVQQSPNAGEFFKRQQLENLLNSPGYAANLIGLFQREPKLGLVFPPTVHIGFPTLGAAWFSNREPTEALLEDLGIKVPLDGVSPLAPFGAMFVARPESLRIITDVEWKYEDYNLETDHSDGSLAHVQERIFAYAAGELGYHVRTVATLEYAAISHTLLEYKLDELGAAIPGYAIDQVHNARGGGWMNTTDPVAYAKVYLTRRHPVLFAFLRVALRPARSVYRICRRVTPRRSVTEGD